MKDRVRASGKPTHPSHNFSKLGFFLEVLLLRCHPRRDLHQTPVPFINHFSLSDQPFSRLAICPLRTTASLLVTENHPSKVHHPDIATDNIRCSNTECLVCYLSYRSFPHPQHPQHCYAENEFLMHGMCRKMLTVKILCEQRHLPRFRGLLRVHSLNLERWFFGLRDSALGPSSPFTWRAHSQSSDETFCAEWCQQAALPPPSFSSNPEVALKSPTPTAFLFPIDPF